MIAVLNTLAVLVIGIPVAAVLLAVMAVAARKEDP